MFILFIISSISRHKTNNVAGFADSVNTKYPIIQLPFSRDHVKCFLASGDIRLVR